MVVWVYTLGIFGIDAVFHTKVVWGDVGWLKMSTVLLIYITGDVYCNKGMWNLKELGNGCADLWWHQRSLKICGAIETWLFRTDIIVDTVKWTANFFYGGGCHWVCCLFKVTLQTAQWATKAIDDGVWEDGRKMDDQADWSWDFVVRRGTGGFGVPRQSRDAKQELHMKIDPIWHAMS